MTMSINTGTIFAKKNSLTFFICVLNSSENDSRIFRTQSLQSDCISRIDLGNTPTHTL